MHDNTAVTSVTQEYDGDDEMCASTFSKKFVLKLFQLTDVLCVCVCVCVCVPSCVPLRVCHVGLACLASCDLNCL